MERNSAWSIASTIGLAAAAGTAAALALSLMRQRSFSWHGKRVFITGGSRGLGLTLAREAGARGARLAVCSRSREEVESAILDLRRRGCEAHGFVCDVTDEGQVRQCVEAVHGAFGGIDVLINNAGVIVVGPEEEMEISDYEQLMKVHFWGPLYTTRAVLPFMKAHRGGRIVNIASIGAKVAVPHLAPYSASKFALAGWSESMCTELAAHGIYVTTVYPGLMRTGSQINATFRGDHQKEYVWFRSTSVAPLLSMTAERAARRILAAAERGQSEAVIGLAAKAAALSHGLAPRLVIAANKAITKLLPTGSRTGEKRRGEEIGLPRIASRLTSSIERAAKSHNEAKAGPATPTR